MAHVPSGGILRSDWLRRSDCRSVRIFFFENVSNLVVLIQISKLLIVVTLTLYHVINFVRLVITGNVWSSDIFPY